RKPRHLRLPRAGEARADDRRRLRQLVGPEELEPPLDALPVEPREQPPDEVRRRALPAASRAEADLLSAAARVRGAEQERGAVAVGLVLDHETQARVRPALGKLRLDLPPLLEE